MRADSRQVNRGAPTPFRAHHRGLITDLRGGHTAVKPSGKRGPYTVQARPERFTKQQRAAQLLAPPVCACGCGRTTEWDAGRCRWRPYATRDCYQPPAVHRDRAWLIEHYVDKRLTLKECADIAGVNASSIAKALKRHGIPRRDRSESRVGRNVGDRNPSWKGGVSTWQYAPEWKRIARMIRDRDEWTCQACGDRRARWGKLLHVHHIDGDKLNNDPANLVSVCASCHPRGSGRVERRFAERIAA